MTLSLGRRLVPRLRGWSRPISLAAVLAVVAAVAGALLVAGGGGDTGGVGERREAPTFSLPDTRDEAATVELADYRGMPVVINFWASWCVPCRKEMPVFEAVHQRFRDRVAFVGVNHQDGRTPARELLGETGVTYASGSDPEGKVASAYRLIGMPSTVLVSADGQIVATHTGELSRPRLEEMIEKLLA